MNGFAPATTAFIGNLPWQDAVAWGGGGLLALVSRGVSSSDATPENDYRWGMRDASGEIPIWMDYRTWIIGATALGGWTGFTYGMPRIAALLGTLSFGATYSLTDSEFRRWSESGQILGMDVPDILPEWAATPALATNGNGNGNGVAAPELAGVNGLQ